MNNLPNPIDPGFRQEQQVGRPRRYDPPVRPLCQGPIGGDQYDGYRRLRRRLAVAQRPLPAAFGRPARGHLVSRLVTVEANQLAHAPPDRADPLAQPYFRFGTTGDATIPIDSRRFRRRFPRFNTLFVQACI